MWSKLFGWALVAVGVFLLGTAMLVALGGVSSDTWVIIAVMWGAFCINEAKVWIKKKQ